jgi:hypothetical protein
MVGYLGVAASCCLAPQQWNTPMLTLYYAPHLLARFACSSRRDGGAHHLVLAVLLVAVAARVGVHRDVIDLPTP